MATVVVLSALYSYIEAVLIRLSGFTPARDFQISVWCGSWLGVLLSHAEDLSSIPEWKFFKAGILVF